MTMKKAFIFTALSILMLGFTGQSFADTYVNGYTKSNGTYVQGHYRSSPDSTRSNNWSTKGNTNPYTGKAGTRNSYGSSYGSSGSNNSFGSSGRSNSFGSSGKSKTFGGW